MSMVATVFGLFWLGWLLWTLVSHGLAVHQPRTVHQRHAAARRARGGMANAWSVRC